MSEPLYPAARIVADRLAAHFARHAAARESEPSQAPSAAAIQTLIDAGFWASLLREEGRSPEISLAFVEPEQAERPLLFAAPLRLDPRSLARLAPAVERPGIHLGVAESAGELRVWGTTRRVPVACLVLEVVGPGLLVVKHRTRDDSAKFLNVAVLDGDQVKMLDREAVDVSDQPALLRALLAPESAGAGDRCAELLLRVAVSMREHRRGGTLLVTPPGGEAWRASVVPPIAYAVDPPFTELADLVREEAAGDGPARKSALARSVDALAGLTAVDGATVITTRFELLAFGVKLARPEGRPRVEKIVVAEPVEASRGEIMAPLHLGGTRHISAAQFVQDQQDALALVASQDGRFTLFAWSPRREMVLAIRFETLLL